MSRCIRKVENEDFYIVYCNTSDVVFPYMFDSIESASYYVNAFDNNESWANDLDSSYNPYSLEDLKECKNE